MDADEIRDFYQVLARSLSDRWTESGLRKIARLSAPTGMLGKNEWLLRADHAMTVGRWFIEGLVDIERHVRGNDNAGHLFQEFMVQLNVLIPHAPEDDLEQAAKQLAMFAWREVETRRAKGRESINVVLKRAVWFNNAPDQRCYLCGYQFSQHAADLHLRRTRQKIVPLNLVDFTRPRGTKPRHLQVELDHVIPVAEGGLTDEDNLRLACGWCNIVKSNRWSMYDAKSWAAGVIEHPKLGTVTIPQPLWLVRLVAARGRCEAKEKCPARLKDSELFIAPYNLKGALTPTNLAVYCGKHDPWAAHRLVSPTLLDKK